MEHRTRALKTIALVGFFALCIARIDSANILCVFPDNSQSHLIVHMSIITALLEHDHNITVVSTLPLQDRSPNLHHIYVAPSNKRMREVAFRKSKMIKGNSKFQMMFRSINIVLAMGPSQVDVIKHKTFQDFMNNPHNKFDLLILGYFFNDYLFGLGVHFKCPIVMSWTGPPNIFVGRHIGNPLELAYASSTPMMGVSDPLKFTGRLSKFTTALSSAGIVAVLQMQMTGLYRQLFPAPLYPSMEEAAKKVSLLLCNSHFTEGNIRPNVPSLIEIGGIHIKEKTDLLPKDLKRIVDTATEHGIIYVSFGSNIGPSDLRPGTLEIVYKVLSSLPQTILWKWSSDQLPGKASNIHYRKWLPQDDLLAHPNIRLFVTHAGKGSVSESQYHGVPMVAIPIFADQPGNAEQLASNGFGLQVDIFTMTEKTFRSAILEVLENPVYTENLKKFSEIYRDRPLTARRTAVYWIEYVIRHKGAYHMQSPLVHLNSLQYMCIDVLAFLFALIFIAVKLIQLVFRYFKLVMIRKALAKVNKKLKKN